MPSPLHGIVVVDMTRLLPGGYCTALLQNLGATVIKVEQPGVGDYQREMGTQVAEAGALFHLVNRGKSSISLNLKDSAGAEALRALILQEADVVVESFRPGVLARLGLSWPELQALKPSLVCASLSGYGSNGPMAQTAGHDINYMAQAGYLRPPYNSDDAAPLDGVPWADLIGGALIPALGILGLLVQARQTGRGGVLDAAFAEGLAMLPYLRFAEELLGSTTVDSQNEADTTSPTIGAPYYSIYELKDGHVAVGAVEPQFWSALCSVLGLHEFLDNQNDLEHWAAIRQALSAAFATMARADVATQFSGIDACVTVVNDHSQALQTEQLRDRDVMRPSVVTPELPILGSPFMIDGSRPFIDLPSPRIGEDTTILLQKLGLSPSTIAHLLESGVAVQAELAKTGPLNKGS